LRFLDPGRPLRVVLVTSPMQGDGKTVTAANLAIALALSGERVILVDADLRRAGLGRALDVEAKVGLTSVILGRAGIDEALQDWRPNLKVLASGPLPPNPSEILGSQLMNGVIHDLAARADIVIIDAPPILPVADALALAPQVDGVVMIVRHSSTLRSAAMAAGQRLGSIGARLVGYVFNAVPRVETRDYYSVYSYRAYTGGQNGQLPNKTVVPRNGMPSPARAVAGMQVPSTGLSQDRVDLLPGRDSRTEWADSNGGSANEPVVDSAAGAAQQRRRARRG
jgi:non-specific protein-tyrosine kinase